MPRTREHNESPVARPRAMAAVSVFAACLLFLAVAGAPTRAFAWGQEGHSIVAEIAQHRLSPRAVRQVAALLGKGRSLASVASWADNTAHDRPETARWHYVNIPIANSTFDTSMQCAASEQGDCIVAELERLAVGLRCGTQEERTEALRYAVHLVGDLHQPLHTVAEAAGGNTLYVDIAFNGATCRSDCALTHVKLHSVWDSLIINRTVWDWGAYVDRLEGGWLRTPEASQAGSGQVVDWMLETHAIASSIWVNANAPLDDAYYQRSLQIVDRQLGRAGVRLAAFLNSAYASNRCPH